MAFSKGKDNSENTVNNDNHKNNDILAFVKQNIRYFTAGALFIVLVLVLVNCGAPKNNDEGGENVAATETESETEEVFEVDVHEDVNALINQYFTAYAAGDVDTIAAIATPISENEKSYIAEYSKYVDSYENIKCYTKRGLDDSSYLVSVSIEIKFSDAEMMAPGLDFFYVRTNEDGSLFIDNLYSQYNSKIKENAVDTSVQRLIDKFEESADLIALQQEIQGKYNEAVAADATLADVINVKLPAAMTAWKQDILAQAAENETEAPEETEVPEETETTETPEETETPEPEQTEDKAETVYAIDTVNVRAAADTASEKIGTVEKGTAIGRTGTDGDWSIVNYGGTTGYIKTEYLAIEKPQTDNNNSDNTADTSENTTKALSEGQVITLSGSTNIRSGMSETSDKIGTAFAGEKVTVVMSYAEGWTKVTWNGETGYIKTDLLQ